MREKSLRTAWQPLPAAGGRACAGRARALHWFDVDLQAVDSDHANGLAFGDRLTGKRSPQFAMKTDHALGTVRNGRNHDALSADHFFGSGLRFPRARTQDQTHQHHGEHRKRKRDRKGYAEAHAASGERRANQKHRAEKHGDDTARSEYAVAGVV